MLEATLGNDVDMIHYSIWNVNIKSQYDILIYLELKQWNFSRTKSKDIWMEDEIKDLIQI